MSNDFEDALFSNPDNIKPAEPKKAVVTDETDTRAKTTLEAPEIPSSKLDKVTQEELSAMIKGAMFKFKTRPRHHQLVAFLKSRDAEEFAYFMEMGTGKSKVGIDNAAYLYDKGEINALLVFSNKGSYRNWSEPEEGEIVKHMPAHVEYFMTHWEAGANKQLRATYDELFKPRDDLKILIMNTEAMSYDRGVKMATDFVKLHRTMVIVDESTTIKNRDAKRTKNVVKLRRISKYRRIMTGSPVTKTPMDLYAPCEFLHPSLLGFSSYYSFQSHYADLVQREARQGNRVQTYKAIIGYKHLDELRDVLEKFSFRVRKEECLDLPPKIYMTYDVDLTDEQAKHYKNLVKECMTEIEGSMVSSTVVLTQLLRLHQLVCGYLVTDDKRIIEVANNRVNALLDIIEETGKVIIWATYRKDIQLIAKTLAEKFGEDSVITYYGDTTSDERADAVKRFQDSNDSLRFFVGNPKVGGYGVTLTEASTVVYYSNNYDLEVRLQSEDRAHRIGQTKSVTYVDLVARGTVDEKILKALRSKRNLAAEVLGDPNTFKEWLQ